jgi:hypothetical protein
MYNSLVIRRNISKSGFVYKSHSRFTPSNKIFIYFFRQTQMHTVDCERQYTSIGALHTVNPNRAAAPWRHLAGYDRKFIARRNTCFFFFLFTQNYCRIFFNAFTMQIYSISKLKMRVYTTATRRLKVLAWKIRFSNWRCCRTHYVYKNNMLMNTKHFCV